MSAMTHILLPALSTMIYLGGSCGPDNPVTGKIALGAICVWVASYIGCRIGDWLFDKPWKRVSR
jgi:hypothetical protein